MQIRMTTFNILPQSYSHREGTRRGVTKLLKLKLKLNLLRQIGKSLTYSFPVILS